MSNTFRSLIRNPLRNLLLLFISTLRKARIMELAPGDCTKEVFNGHGPRNAEEEEVEQ